MNCAIANTDGNFLLLCLWLDSIKSRGPLYTKHFGSNTAGNGYSVVQYTMLLLLQWQQQDISQPFNSQ